MNQQPEYDVKFNKTDRDLELNGIWLDFGGGSQIKVRRAGGANRAFAAQLAKRMRPHKRKLDAGTLDDSVAEKIMHELYFDEVLVEWTGNWPMPPDGDEVGMLEFNKYNVCWLFETYPDEIYAVVREGALDYVNFLKEQATDLGNASPPSIYYELTTGRREDQIIEAAAEIGGVLPQAIEERPELREDERFYWDAYNELATCRPPADPPRLIPWSAIAEYADRYAFDLEFLAIVIWIVDEQYIQFCIERSKEQRERQENPEIQLPRGMRR